MGLVSRGMFSGLVRRVAARHDIALLLLRFVAVERPTELALGRLDLVVPGVRGANSWEAFPTEAQDLIGEVETVTGVGVTLVSAGPTIDELVDLRPEVSA